MKPAALTKEEQEQLLEDIKDYSIGQLAKKYDVSRICILNYLRKEFLRARKKLIEEGKTESEATLEAYKETYKCTQTVITIEY